MDMLALKLIVESEMHPTKNPRFQLPANYSKYFRDVPKMIFTEDKWYLLVKSKEAAGLIGNRQFCYPSNGFIPSCSIFLRKDVTSTENSAALHFKSSNVPLKPNLISEVDKENGKRREKKNLSGAKILQTERQLQLEIQKHTDQANCNLAYLMEVGVFMLCIPIFSHAKDI